MEKRVEEILERRAGLRVGMSRKKADECRSKAVGLFVAFVGFFAYTFFGLLYAGAPRAACAFGGVYALLAFWSFRIAKYGYARWEKEFEEAKRKIAEEEDGPWRSSTQKLAHPSEPKTSK